MLKLAALAALPIAGVVVFLLILSGYSPPPEVVTDALAGAGGGEYAPSAAATSDIPADLLALYQAAARTCPGLDWAILAGIGKIETNHGRSTLPGVRSGANSAGAMGPMQFLQGTWDQYKTAAPGHLIANVYDIADAIYSAAKLLCHDGARIGLPLPPKTDSGAWKRLHDAIFAYNHVDWYVSLVEAQADAYRGAWVPATSPVAAVTAAGIAPGNPLGPDCPHPPISQGFGPSTLQGEPAAHGYTHFHTGWDLACPFGTPVREIGAPGVLTLNPASSSGGFGNEPVVEIRTTAGRHYFVRYGHLDAFAPGLRSGQAVKPGDLLGYEGCTGYCTGPHLHFEVDDGSLSVQASVNPTSWLAL
jgi:murein DD-endopeptidase MepM/ murein hydrolase activator NlpD